MSKAKDYGYDFSKFKDRDLDYWQRINSYANASYYEWKNNIAENIAKDMKNSSKGILSDLARVAGGAYDIAGNVIKSSMINDTLATTGMFTRKNPDADAFNISKQNDIKEFVIAFKGSDDLADFFRDAHPAGPEKAAQSAKNAVFDGALKQLQMNIGKCDKVVITGHSLGGFLASEFVLYVREKMGEGWWRSNSSKLELSTVDTIGLSNDFLNIHNSKELTGLTQRHLIVDGSIAEKSRDNALINLLTDGNMLHSPSAIGAAEVVPTTKNFIDAHFTSNLRAGLLAERIERDQSGVRFYDIPHPSSVGKVISLKQGVGMTRLEEKEVPIYPNPSL